MAAASAAGAAWPEDSLRAHLTLIDLDRTVRPAPQWMVDGLRVGSAMFALVFAALAATMFVAQRRTSPRWIERARDDLATTWAHWRDEFAGWRRESTRGHVIALVLLILVGVLLRLALAFRPVSSDEATTFVYFASRSPLDVLTDRTIPNNHALHTFLAWASTSLFGATPWTLRLPAFAFGLLLIPAAYALGRRLFGREPALMCAAFVAGAPVMVEYSAQARGYTAMTAFFVLAFLFATQLVRQRTKAAWALLAISMALGLYAVPSILYGGLVVGAWVLLAAPKSERTAMLRGLLFAGLAACVIAGLLYLPAFVRAGLSRALENPYVQRAGWSAFARETLGSWRSAFECWFGAWPAPIALVLGAAPLAAIALAHSGRRVAIQLVAALVFTIQPALVIQRMAPPQRILFFAYPLVAALCAQGMWALVQRVTRRDRGSSSWSAACVALCVAWGALRLSREPGEPFGVAAQLAPGQLGVNCCVEGYFTDSEAIVERFYDELGPRDAIVAHRSSSAVEALQFHLVATGRDPTRIHPYARLEGVEQLAVYERVFLVVRTLERWDLKTVEDVLGVGAETVEMLFEAPRRLATFQQCEVHELRPRAGAWSGLSNPPDLAARLRDNMRYPGLRD